MYKKILVLIFASFFFKNIICSDALFSHEGVVYNIYPYLSGMKFAGSDPERIGYRFGLNLEPDDILLRVLLSTKRLDANVNLNKSLTIPMRLLKKNSEWYKNGDDFTLIYRDGNTVNCTKCKCDANFDKDLKTIIDDFINAKKQLIGFYTKDLEMLKKIGVLRPDTQESEANI